MSRNCPVCDSAAAAELQIVNYALLDDSPLPRRTVIRSCDACFIAYADSDASESDYLGHYRVNSIYAATEIRSGAGLSEPDRDRLDQAAGRFVRKLRETDLFIDVGAGGGGLLRTVSGHTECRLLGLDPDPRCVDSMAATGMPSRLATLDALPEEFLGTARVVALSHVLEHLWQPGRDLANALKLAAEDGFVYVEVPDAGRYADFPNVPFYYFDPEHINHFSLASLAALAKSADGHWVDGGEAEIMLTGGIRYPVCWALIGRTASSNQAPIPSALRQSVMHTYLEKQRAIGAASMAVMKNQLFSLRSSYVVWGAGSQAQRVLAQGVLNTDRILAFADGDVSKHGRTLVGRPIQSPTEALSHHPDAPVVIAAAASAANAIDAILARDWPNRLVLDLTTNLDDVSRSPHSIQ